MKPSILLAGLLGAFLSSGAFAQTSTLDEAPSPTVVYSDLVTIGGPVLGGMGADSGADACR
ncbi:hypothetical protein [Roseococcus sp.]|uniref:hypothetical protein n=1 Tax=Roseococcus sp. TaxID=2109646 RepID=UPI003BA8EA68